VRACVRASERANIQLKDLCPGNGLNVGMELVFFSALASRLIERNDLQPDVNVRAFVCFCYTHLKHAFALVCECVCARKHQCTTHGRWLVAEGCGTKLRAVRCF